MKKKTRNLIIGIILALVVTAGVCTGLIIRKRINDRTVNIAFYGLSEKMMDEIKKYIPQEEKIILKYTVLAPGNVELGTLSSKYDLLFTWKGEVTAALEGGVEAIPGKILENIPNSLRNKSCLPLLLDHYEMDLYKPVLQKTGISEIDSFDGVGSYLTEASKYVFSPFFTNGGNDRTLLALIGSVVEAEGGVKAYNKLIAEMRKASTLEEFINVELGAEGGASITVGKVLDMFKDWAVNGLCHPQWFIANDVDVNVFAQDKQLAAIFTSLSHHREMSYKIVSEYETVRMPYTAANVDHGIIAPAVCAVLISDNGNCKNYLKNIMTADVQSEMSNITMLGPVHYRAECYDVQADDVRFWAASCAGGAMPDLSLAVYQRKPDLQASIASEIRLYLKN